MITSRSVHLPHMALFHSFYGWVIFHCLYIFFIHMLMSLNVWYRSVMWSGLHLRRITLTKFTSLYPKACKFCDKWENQRSVPRKSLLLLKLKDILEGLSSKIRWEERRYKIWKGAIKLSLFVTDWTRRLGSITDSKDMSLSKLGVSGGRRSLACCSPWGHRESGVT